MHACHNSPIPGEGPLRFSRRSGVVFGFWHILLTCAPFAGGLSNALAVFTRRGPTPRAHSLKIWRSCSHSFRGSPLACLFSRGTLTRGVAAISGAKSATSCPRTLRACISAPPVGIDMPSSVPRWGTCPPPPPTTADPCVDFQFSRGFCPGPLLPWSPFPSRIRVKES